ncbi:hypothetical protein NC652_027703 [Populus alba x Populus x berolinensis]|nr:hypothetical protein NC652_027703 [Populus alba x Populus x berolinensis]
MLRTVIGDGRSANAWSDSWVPDLPNSRISSSRSPILQGGVGNMPEKHDCHLSSELGDTPTKELERASLQASWDAKLIIQQTDYLRQQSSSDLEFLVLMQDISSTSKSKVLQPTVSIISLVNGRLAYPLWVPSVVGGPRYTSPLPKPSITRRFYFTSFPQDFRFQWLSMRPQNYSVLCIEATYQH